MEICAMTVTDRDFLLHLMNGLINIEEQFDKDTRKYVGPLYYIRKGNLEVISSITQKIRDHLAENLEEEDWTPEQIEEAIEEISGVSDISKGPSPVRKVIQLECSVCHLPWEDHILTDVNGSYKCPVSKILPDSLRCGKILETHDPHSYEKEGTKYWCMGDFYDQE